ncbi:MAG TPA: hypothetical protein VK986_23125, partial [Tepidisphaeraceae bacterium]|nr:hypothetical protein [Tepidisphaeraceae bacterium]
MAKAKKAIQTGRLGNAETPARARGGPARARLWEHGGVAAGVVAVLVTTFAGMSWWGVQDRSATFDEPLQAAATYVVSRHHDYRVDLENPPLWQYWAALGTGGAELKMDLGAPDFRRVLGDESRRWAWSVATLYSTPGNDADRALGSLRRMLIVLGAGLGALVAWWGWRLGGTAAAVLAACLYCLDPNFLAHAALVKNDVAISLATLAAAMAVWAGGRGLTAWRAGAIAIAVGVLP